MASIKRGINYLLHNRAQFCDSIVKNYLGWLPDKPYLSLRYRCQMGYWIDWKNPKTFNEKIQWLKVYDFKPEYTKMVDKYAVKDYVASIIGEEYIIPTLGVWDSVKDIDWNSLPNQFVLKTTHGGGGGGVVICSDKSKFDRKTAEKKLSASMKSNVTSTREHPYYNVPKRIIAEKYITDAPRPEVADLVDYKFFCFDGKVKYLAVHAGRFTEHFSNYYDSEWNLQNWGFDCPVQLSHVFQCPANFEEMKSIAEKLSSGHKFLRVDLYNVEGKIYFGELTFYPASGFGKFTPEEWDGRLGDLIQTY